MKDTVGAFVPDGMFRLDGASEGPLAGTTFAAKDIIDVAGRTTSCGNPDWLRDSCGLWCRFHGMDAHPNCDTAGCRAEEVRLSLIHTYGSGAWWQTKRLSAWRQVQLPVTLLPPL